MFDGIRTVYMYFTIWVIIPVCASASHIGLFPTLLLLIFLLHQQHILFYFMLEIPNFQLTCIKNLYDMCNITVFTVNNLPDFIYLFNFSMLSGLDKNASRLWIVKENYSSIHSTRKRSTKYWPYTTQFCEFVPSSLFLLSN